MTTNDELSARYGEVARGLPPGWRLDGLRCDSTGLAPEERSEEWRAVAVGPDDTSVSKTAGTSLEALDHLRAHFAEAADQ